MGIDDRRLLSSSEINQIVGKNLVEKNREVDRLAGYIWALEEWLDEIEADDIFGTEGWRHVIGHPDGD